MTDPKLAIEYLKKIQEKYVDGEGLDQVPLPEYYALDDAIEALQKVNAPKKREYKITRSYHNGEMPKHIQELFDEGWQLEKTSEFVPQVQTNQNIYYGYIEYILSKETTDDKG